MAPLLDVDNVHKSFGGVKTLTAVTFSLSRGQVLGLIGPNGAGKTTVFNIISGIYRADRGTVLLDGKAITNRAPVAIAKHALGFFDGRFRHVHRQERGITHEGVGMLGHDLGEAVVADARHLGRSVRTPEPFDRRQLTALVRRYLIDSKVGKMGGCHLFRHTVATLMLENGADIRVIQEMLGHVKLDTTQLYTRVSINLLRQVYSATHPAAHLKRPEMPATSAAEDEANEATVELFEALAVEEIEDGEDE